jgi:hypothetical protein
LPFLVSPPLHQDIKHVAALIHRPPQIVALFVNGDEEIIEVPLIARPRTPASQLISIRLAEFPTPLADRFIRNNGATDEQKFFHITVAQWEAEIQPDRVTDDFPWKPVVFVELRRG